MSSTPTNTADKGEGLRGRALYSEVVFSSPDYEKVVDGTDVAALVIGMLFLALFLCAVAVYLSKRQERIRREKRKDEIEDKGKQHASGLTTRQWNLEHAVRTWDVEGTEGSLSSDCDRVGPSAYNNVPGKCTSVATIVPLGQPEEEEEDAPETSPHTKAAKQSTSTNTKRSSKNKQHLHHALQPQHPQQQNPFQHLYECQICVVAFQDGDDIYESNNPKCLHSFHKACMHKWLNYQYSCPICSEVYVLPTTTTVPTNHQIRTQDPDDADLPAVHPPTTTIQQIRTEEHDDVPVNRPTKTIQQEITKEHEYEDIPISVSC